MDAHVEQRLPEGAARAEQGTAPLGAWMKGAWRMSEFGRAQELPVALARERAEKLGMHGWSFEIV